MVGPDPHGNSTLFAKIDKWREPLPDSIQLGRVLFVRIFANEEFLRVGVIAGVDPDFVYPFGRFHRGFGFEMDIGHDWHIAAALAQSLHDVFQIARVLHRGRGNSHNFATDLSQLDRLLDRHLCVHRVARDHRLDANRTVPADADIAYADLARGTATKRKWRRAILHSLNSKSSARPAQSA